MCEAGNISIYYEAADITEISVGLKQDWGIDLGEMTREDDYLLGKVIFALERQDEYRLGEQGARNIDSILDADEYDRYGIGFNNGKISLTLNLSKANLIYTLFCIGKYMHERDTSVLIEMAVALCKINIYSDPGKRCIYCKAIKESKNSPFKKLQKQDIEPYIREGDNRICGMSDAFPICKLHEGNNGCLLKEDDINRILASLCQDKAMREIENEQYQVIVTWSK